MERQLKKIGLTIIIVICIIVLAGCCCTDQPEYIEENVEFGSYHLYRTNDPSRYLQFLDSFDDSKFEIVDISYGYCSYVDGARKHDKFFVTYRSK